MNVLSLNGQQGYSEKDDKCRREADKLRTNSFYCKKCPSCCRVKKKASTGTPFGHEVNKVLGKLHVDTLLKVAYNALTLAAQWEMFGPQLAIGLLSKLWSHMIRKDRCMTYDKILQAQDESDYKSAADHLKDDGPI